MLPKAACIDCETRKLGCHGKCEKYKEFKDELDRIREAKRMETDFLVLQREMSYVRRHMDHHKKRRETIV